ncbi:MAG: formimidoylglutamate deiminase [Actinobacteria bacterium]|nr:formimidoylglutamate deiminase [Actinomycetota bacterium]
MGDYWCELAWLGGASAISAVLIREAGGLITDVQRGVPCSPDATRLSGLTLPGLANGHSHAFHRALRGRTQVGTGSFWTWREQMYALAATLQPDTYFELARAVYGEMALAGITVVGEFHYLHHDVNGTPYAHPNAMSEALVAAAREVGIRITLLDTCYLHGGFGQPPNEVQQRFSDGDGEAWASRVSSFHVDGRTARVGAALHSVRAVDPRSTGIVAEWAAQHDVPLHAHVSEQSAENQQCIDMYGMTPTLLLHEHGVLSERFTSVHATHLSGVDIGLYGANGCTICMCPTTERDLADGIGPARSLRQAGAELSLGTDSHAVIDLFEEARAVELNERLATNTRGHHDATSLLQAATVNGHRSLGWGQAGTLEVGKVADFVSVRLDTVRTAGASEGTALESAVFAASAADVHHLVVDGKVIVRDGAHRSIDVASELTRTIALVAGRP